MALPQIISRNQIQRIPTTALNVRKVLSGGTDGDFYTCPTGKKAVIKVMAVCTGLGAAASVDLDVAGVTIQEWTSGTPAFSTAATITTNMIRLFEVQLEAGDILQYTQNSGTNAEMNINAEILETPV